MWRNTEKSYGWFGIMLHWLTALAVFCLFGLGLYMVQLGYYHVWYNKAPSVHMSIGMMLLIIMLVRMLWALINIKPKPLITHSGLEKFSACIAHVLLYFLCFVVLISGYLIQTGKGLPVTIIEGVNVPVLFEALTNQEQLAGVVHFWFAWVLVVLVLIHAGAALKHHYIDKDETLMRMLHPRAND